MSPSEALRKAIEIAGSQSALARSIERKPGHVWYWLEKAGRVSASHVLAVERVTGVSRHDLRPDIYPREKEEAA